MEKRLHYHTYSEASAPKYVEWEPGELLPDIVSKGRTRTGDMGNQLVRMKYERDYLFAYAIRLSVF